MIGRDHYKGVPKPGPEDVNINKINNGSHLDAFARQRFSSPYTLFDNYFTSGKDPEVWADEVQGGSTTWQSDLASVFLTVGPNSGDKVYRQTKTYFGYQPGKSFSFVMSFVLSPGKTGLRQRLGYFNSKDGLFLQMQGDELSFVVRSHASGAPVDTVYKQSEWNQDSLDGSGASNISIDTNKVQVFFVDFEWFGAGVIRFGFLFGGRVVYCHNVDNSNSIDNVFMSRPSLPLRFEIENIEEVGESSTLKQICSTVISEGGYNPKGSVRSINTGKDAVNITAKRPVLSVRLKGDFPSGQLDPLNFSALSVNNDNILVEMFLETALNSPVWEEVSPESISEVDYSSTSFTGGRLVWSAYTSDRLRAIFSRFDFQEAVFSVSTTISGASEVFTVAITPVESNNANVSASLVYKERP